MFKSFFIKALLLVTLSLLPMNLLTGQAIAKPLLWGSVSSLPELIAQQDVTPPASRSELAPPVEPATDQLPAQNDKTLDFRSSEAQQHQDQPLAASTRANRDRPQDPYEDYYNAIRQFNQEVYGENG